MNIWVICDDSAWINFFTQERVRLNSNVLFYSYSCQASNALNNRRQFIVYIAEHASIITMERSICKGSSIIIISMVISIICWESLANLLC